MGYTLEQEQDPAWRSEQRKTKATLLKRQKSGSMHEFGPQELGFLAVGISSLGFNQGFKVPGLGLECSLGQLAPSRGPCIYFGEIACENDSSLNLNPKP